MHLLAVGARDRLGFEVDRHHRVGAFLGVLHQLVADFLGQGDRQDAVLETVVVKDVGEARGDDATDAEIEQGPRRVLAARPAAEILGADQDLGIAVGRLVQDEIRVLRPVRAKADFLEQPLRQPGALDRLQIDRRKDLVGVEIVDRQRRSDAGQLGKFVHVCSSSNWRLRPGRCSPMSVCGLFGIVATQSDHQEHRSTAADYAKSDEGDGEEGEGGGFGTAAAAAASRSAGGSSNSEVGVVDAPARGWRWWSADLRPSSAPGTASTRRTR